VAVTEAVARVDAQFGHAALRSHDGSDVVATLKAGDTLNLAAGTYFIRVTSDTTGATAGNQFNYRLVTIVR
jgi:hypothetical protein